MHLFSDTMLTEFCIRHPLTRSAAIYWKDLIQKESFANFAELKNIFRSADYVAPFTIFNVGGSHCRIVARVEFPKQRVRIEGVFTHPEYEKWTKRYLRGKVQS